MKKKLTKAEKLAAVRHKPIEGHTIDEWEKHWKHVPDWQNADTPELRTHCGLIRFRLRDDIMYISRAAGKRGFHKRLRDILCRGTGPRNHHGGRMVYSHRDQVEADILILGDRSMSPTKINPLKAAMLLIHDPEWRVPQDIVGAAIQQQRQKAA